MEICQFVTLGSLSPFLFHRVAALLFQRLSRKRAMSVKLSKVGSFRRNSAASLFDTSEDLIFEQEM